MAQIQLRQVSKSYGDTLVIPGVDLEVQDGEFLVFVGPSGCGKSTMLRMLAGLESITSGDVLFDGQRVNDIGSSDRGAAMVFQSYALYPHMTVAENMGFALRMAGHSKAQRQAAVEEVAQTLQLTPLLDRYPKQLSGGQRQRVAIGRAIVRRPKVFLFDEPLSNLDAALRVQMRIELARLHGQLGTTMIYVTHDQTEAMTLGDRIAVFNKGRIEQVGAPMDLYRQPANRFVAEFLGSPKINVMPYRVDAAGQRLVLGDGAAALPLDTLQSMAALLSRGEAIGWRPESLGLCEPGRGLPGQIEFVEKLGDVTVIYVRTPAHTELVAVKHNGESEALRMGTAVGLMPLDAGLVFDAQGQRVDA
ncbi:ABC transporter ATP-binding protein [Amphibiibacter pelophylacis]|uniref:Sn-glycerol-3-phosphate ABC transporter ATP-binding protein UgpC n=1 Tax=Amphibiibacter pelophylacis TaxID=1799477 RepID=A0ACC6P2E5_9BURK